MLVYDESMNLEQWARDMMAEHGWYVLYILDDPQTPFGVSYHTFGLRETFGHPDLQICLRINQDLAHAVFSAIVERIRTGARYEDGGCYAGLLKGEYSLRFAASRNDGRKLLRILIPDTNDSLDTEPYSMQLDMLSDGSKLAALHYEVSDLSTRADVENFTISLVLDYHLAMRPGTRFEALMKGPAGSFNIPPRDVPKLDALLQRCYKLYGEEKFNQLLATTSRVARQKIRQVQSKQRHRKRRGRS